MSNREIMQQALEAWENPLGMKDLCVAMDALRAALAEQCPHGADDGCKECYVAEDALQRLSDIHQEMELVIDCPRCGHCCPQRKPLSDEQIEQIADGIPVDDFVGPTTWHLKLARAVEAAHGIKGKA